MTELLSPALILVAGAVLTALLRGHLRSAVIFATPLVTLWRKLSSYGAVRWGLPSSPMSKCGSPTWTETVWEGRQGTWSPWTRTQPDMAGGSKRTRPCRRIDTTC